MGGKCFGMAWQSCRDSRTRTSLHNITGHLLVGTCGTLGLCEVAVATFVAVLATSRPWRQWISCGVLLETGSGQTLWAPVKGSSLAREECPSLGHLPVGTTSSGWRRPAPLRISVMWCAAGPEEDAPCHGGLGAETPSTSNRGITLAASSVPAVTAAWRGQQQCKQHIVHRSGLGLRRWCTFRALAHCIRGPGIPCNLAGGVLGALLGNSCCLEQGRASSVCGGYAEPVRHLSCHGAVCGVGAEVHPKKKLQGSCYRLLRSGVCLRVLIVVTIKTAFLHLASWTQAAAWLAGAARPLGRLGFSAGHTYLGSS